jgi:RND superfamily putative drug exporter
MRSIIRLKWFWLVFWIAILAVILFTMPSMDTLIREKGQPNLSGTYSSSTASKLLAEFHKSDKGGKNLDTILVFHNPKGFQSEQKNQIEQKLKQIEQNKNLPIQSLLSPFESKDAEKRLLSADQKTIMAIASVEKTTQTIPQIRTQFEQQMQIAGIQTYLTGDGYIEEDYAKNSIDGVKKTEFFTIIFIVLVLILVFRSPVTPVISLLIVAVAYLIAQGTVGLLVEYFDFPFANTTQIFLILVLFGVGTDYNILLFMRFKEELGLGKPLLTSIVETYRTAGKTVFYSGLAVLIGFSMIGFSNFSIYQSAVAVAIGIVFLLGALFTLNPIIMALMAQRLFWPLKNFQGHGQNRLWSRLGHFSVIRVSISILLIVVLCVPVFLFYKNQLSFDNLAEIGPDSPSVKGFNVVSQSFGAGQTLPTTLVIKSKTPMDSANSLAFLDQIHERLTQIKGVKDVYGPTRPNGEYLNDLYLSKQTKGVSSGINQSSSGLGKISQGLSTASDKIKTSTSGDLNDINKLIDGTVSVRSGLGQVQTALSQINKGMKQGATGAEQIESGLANLETALKKVNSSTKQLSSGYTQISNSLGKLAPGYQGIASGINSLAALNSTIQTSVASLEKNHPELEDDASLTSLKNASNSMNQALPTLQQNITKLNSSLSALNSSLASANKGLSQISSAQSQITAGTTQLKKGAGKLAKGLTQGASGQSQVISSIPSMNDGLHAITNGQRQVLAGLNDFESKMKELQQGLSQSANGLDKINNGLSTANNYLTEVTGEGSPYGTFFVPKEVRNSKEFQTAMDLYMSKDRKIVTWTIPLNVDPYSKEAMRIAHEIDTTIREAISHTQYTNLQIGTGGVSSVNYDLRNISDEDFSLTIILMLAGIGVLLLIMYRSVWITVTILGTLILAYYFSLTVSENIFTNFFGVTGLSWTIPFFSFIMIIALGVDYSIFVMMRYKEYKHQGMVVAILKALERTGSVVISAAIILAGTFAAMYPSGVTTLVQIATVVIIALLLLVFVLLPMILPASISLLDRIMKSDQKTTIPEKSDDRFEYYS